MALLSRLFSSKKNNKPSCNSNAEKNERSSWKPFTFGKDQVRVLLFRECDWRGRKLLFDSNAVQKVALENSCKLRFASRQKPDKCKKEGFVEVTNGYGYQYTKPSSDAKLLEEMMFGAVAMNFRGTALKVHSMATPNRLMCTKVFPSPVVTHTNRRTSDRSLEDSYGSSVNSMSEYFSQNSGSESLLASGPLDVPIGEIAVPKASRYNSLEGDSGYCGDFSLQSVSTVGSPSYWTPVASPEPRNSFGSPCGKKPSGGSLSSLQRRWIRNMSTSLELGVGTADEVPTCAAQHRRTKLGLAVVITLTEDRTTEMESFLFEHMSMLEAMVERLRSAVERAYLRKETFVHAMHEGWSDVQQAVCDMLTSRRLQRPVWLSLTSADGGGHSGLAAGFLQDLCALVATLDTKATNFFVSTLVTGILTHHLGWVNTVWPSNIQTTNSADNSPAADSLNDLLKSHPYNPLWAQLGDLYGALGSPTKVAKTIITTNGRRTDCVSKLLGCMTYFIRCGEVRERVSDRSCDDEALTVLAIPPLSQGGDFDRPESFQTARSKNKRSPEIDPDGTAAHPGMIRTFHDLKGKTKLEVDSSVVVPTGAASKDLELRKPVTPQDFCFARSRMSGFYVEDTQKRLDIKLDILGQEMEQFREGRKFATDALGGGNFASPAGAEWEKGDYPTGETPDKSGSDPEGPCFSGLMLTTGGNVRLEGDEGECRTETEDLYRSGSTFGLRSMRRTSRCISQMSELRSTPDGSNLYPSIDELAKMENVRLDPEAPYAGPQTLSEGNLTELITEKVSKLCRVPTMAVMFHLDQETEEPEFGATTEEFKFEAIRCESERQRRSAESSQEFRVAPFRDVDLRKSSSQEVLFVLGDNEELKGIGKRCSGSDSNVSSNDDVWGCASEGEGGCLIDGNPKVVTVKSSSIDLEDVPGLADSEVSALPRSFSVSLPLGKHRRQKRSAKILRRHTEKYCDRCRTMLRLECRGEGGARPFVGCDKCRPNEAVSGSLGSSLADWGRLGSKVEDVAGVEPGPREDNAIFEQYDPSDEEILGPQSVEPEVVLPLEVTYGDLHIVDLPLPRCDPRDPEVVGLAASLLGGVTQRYVPDLVLQGCSSLPSGWEAALRRDLTLSARLPLLGHEVAEAVCVVADTHTWEVQLVSSHAYVVDKPGTLGVCVGMSQLVANMLESLVHLWRLRMPPEHCLLHMESKLRELYLRSQALAELLLTTEFCNMATLTSSLDLEANDVPLLLAVASTHSPQIAHRYGLSFG